jgi:hypothetical protein
MGERQNVATPFDPGQDCPPSLMSRRNIFNPASETTGKIKAPRRSGRSSNCWRRVRIKIAKATGFPPERVRLRVEFIDPRDLVYTDSAQAIANGLPPMK